MDAGHWGWGCISGGLRAADWNKAGPKAPRNWGVWVSAGKKAMDGGSLPAFPLSAAPVPNFGAGHEKEEGRSRAAANLARQDSGGWDKVGAKAKGH